MALGRLLERFVIEDAPGAPGGLSVRSAAAAAPRPDPAEYVWARPAGGRRRPWLVSAVASVLAGAVRVLAALRRRCLVTRRNNSTTLT